MTQTFNYILMILKSRQWGLLLQSLWMSELFVYFSNFLGVDSSNFWRISGVLSASKPCLARTC